MARNWTQIVQHLGGKSVGGASVHGRRVLVLASLRLPILDVDTRDDGLIAWRTVRRHEIPVGLANPRERGAGRWRRLPEADCGLRTVTSFGHQVGNHEAKDLPVRLEAEFA